MSDKKEKEEDKARKKEEADEAARRSGSIRAEDPELAEWISRQWRNKEFLRELDIVQSFGKKNIVFGLVLDTEKFDPSSPMNQEVAVDICNRFFAAAIRDCTRVQRQPANYYVRAWNESRGAEPVDAFPLYVLPRTTALTRRDPAGGSNEDDGDMTAEKLALAYSAKLIEANQFDRTHISSTFGDIVLQAREREREMRAWISDLMKQNKDMFVEVMAALRAREEALATAEERIAHREMLKLKIELIKDGIYTGRNLLTGLFGKAMAGANTNGGNSGANGSGGPQRSEEQVLLHTFFQDCKNSGIENKLFGEWKKDDQTNMMVCISPGIFTPDQFKLIIGVYRGELAPDALDELDPASGKPLAVTFDQIQDAQTTMPAKMSGLMLQLFDLRKRRRAEAAAAAAAAQTPTATATAVPPTEGIDDV